MFRLPVYPYGVKISQTYAQIAWHFEAIEKFGIGLFVEIGVHRGGLASVLLPRVESVKDFHYLGVEIDAAIIDAQIRKAANIIYGDCLSDEIRTAIKEDIDRCTSPVLIFCDNGNKPAEMRAYAPLLRSGDYISAHDYGIEITDNDLAWIDQDASFEQIEPDVRRYQAGIPLYRKL